MYIVRPYLKKTKTKKEREKKKEIKALLIFFLFLISYPVIQITYIVIRCAGIYL